MTWDTLRPVLVELARRTPPPVRDGPDPRVVGPRRAPFHLRLEPWAVEVAEQLHRRFGAEVMLTVGHFGYPARRPVDGLGRPVAGGVPRRPADEERAELLDPTRLTVDLARDVTVESGHEVRAPLRITNHGSGPVEVRRLHAVVVDSANGAVVGDALPQAEIGHAAWLAPGASAIAPVLVGTASRDPALGYAVPPGEWALRVYLEPGGGRLVRAPLLPLSVA